MRKPERKYNARKLSRLAFAPGVASSNLADRGAVVKFKSLQAKGRWASAEVFYGLAVSLLFFSIN